MITTILIVKDDVAVSNLLIEFLIKSGFTTQSTGNAEETNEILK